MTTPKRKQPLGQSIGGVLFGFEQQVFRNQPPPHELVHHARPDDPVPAGDGTMVSFELPDDHRDLDEAAAPDGPPATPPDREPHP
jgi:hypothetical protein